jgi:hypothetical protein
MKISALRLSNVKRFAGRAVAIEDIGSGVNVLSAANEFGKSTSFEALHALFFLPYSSKGKDAAALKPYSGGSPVIEADVDTPKGRYRLTKQYFAGAMAQVQDRDTGRLLAQADEAESFIADMVSGGASGPTGMLWVRQGQTGLDKRSKSEEDHDRHLRETLLQSVQVEVDAVTGGRRMDEIMRGVTGELDALVTKRGPKAGGPYALAIAERDRLEEEEAQLGREVQQLRSALDERALVQKRLAELTDADAATERAQSLEAAEKALLRAREQAQRLQAAQTSLELAQERHDAAQQRYQGFIAAQMQLEELRTELRALTEKRDAAMRQRDDLRQSIHDAQAKADAAELAEKETRVLLDQVQAHKKAQDAAQKLAGLETKLEQAEAARQAVDTHQALLSQLMISADAVEALAKLDLEIAKLNGMMQAARPSVQVAYEDGAAGRVWLNGALLEDGEARDYAGRAELRVDGVGQILLQSNFAEDSSQLEEAEQRRAALLGKMGVADLAAARAQQERANAHKAEMKQNEMQLAALVPEGVSVLREEIAACQIQAVDVRDAVQIDEQAAADALDAALAIREEVRASLRDLAPALAKSDEVLLRATSQLAELTAKVNQSLAICGADDEQSERRKALADALTPLAAALDAAATEAAQLRALNVDLASAEAGFERASSAVKAAEQDIQNQREKLAGLNGQIRRNTGDAVEEDWLEKKEALGLAQSRVAAFEREVAVLRCLAAALEEARSQARDLYLQPVMSELRPLIGLLFDDAVIQFDEKTLLPEKLIRGGLEEDVDRLSGGMREQLSILTRLAFARLLAKDGQAAPVILDDALVYSDDDRIEKMFNALHRQAQGQQIIVFSCRQRAFQKLGGKILQMTEWQR